MVVSSKFLDTCTETKTRQKQRISKTQHTGNQIINISKMHVFEFNSRSRH